MSGQALVEYVVLLALGSVVAVGTMVIAGPKLSTAFAQLTGVVANPTELLAPPSPTPTAPALLAPAAAAASTSTTPAPAATPASAPTPSPAVRPTTAPTPAQHDDGRHKGKDASAG